VLRTVRLDAIDGRSQAGVFLRRTYQDLAEQLGDDPPPAQASLAVRHFAAEPEDEEDRIADLRQREEFG
jgi:hypothetical protein